MKVALYCTYGGRRGRYVADCMKNGLRRHGIRAEVHKKFRGVNADMAIAYGWAHEKIFEAYKKAGKHFAYFDLGYWDRRPSKMPTDGYYRLAVDDWDTAAKMARGCPDDRFRKLKVNLYPPRQRGTRGHRILIAGMSQKAAETHGYDFREWEKKMRHRLLAMESHFGDVHIRWKPDKKKNISQPPLSDELDRTRLVVTHHSNVAVDALVRGVPFWAEKGVGALLSPPELTAEWVGDPTFPDEKDRKQLLNDIAYAQWRPSEMQSGAAWDHIRRLL